jgi:hypothetical protein
MSRGRVHHHVGNQNGIYKRRPFRKHGACKLHGNIRRTERRPQKNADPVTIFRRYGKARIRKRQTRRSARQKRQSVHAPDIFYGNKIARREITHFRGKMRPVRIGIKRLHGANSAIAFKKPSAKFVLAHAQRCDHPQAGHYNAPAVR